LLLLAFFFLASNDLTRGVIMIVLLLVVTFILVLRGEKSWIVWVGETLCNSSAASDVVSWFRFLFQGRVATRRRRMERPLHEGSEECDQ
jgi:hypothetical protein